MAQPSSLLGPLLVALLLTCPVLSARKDFFLKRYKGEVDSICVSAASKSIPTLDDADTLIIASRKGVQANGKLCSKLVAYTRTSSTQFQVMNNVPPVMATTSFNMSIWSATQNDTVAFTAVNSVPKRPLSIFGTPTPIDLSAPGLGDPSPCQVSLAPQPASAFNISFDGELRVVEAFLDWFFTEKPNAKGLQAAMLVEPDSDDPDSNSWKAIYIIFNRVKNDSLSGDLFEASFSLGPTAAAAAVASSSGRRLLSLASGSGRKLLQYYYYGGGDGTSGGNCPKVCKLVLGQWKCRCI